MLTDAVDFQGPAKNVVIDLADAQLWDISAADTLEKTATRLEGRGKTVTILHADARAAKLLATLGHPNLLA